MVHEETPEQTFAMKHGLDEAERIAFQDALQFDLTPLQDLAKLEFKNARIRDIAAGFETNLLRALDPLGAPAYIIYWARSAQLAECRAFFEITGNAFPPVQLEEEARDRCGAAAVREHFLWFHETLANGIPTDDLMRAESQISGVIAHGTRVGKGFVAMLANTVINLWTAFETVAGDLWETALNIHPHELSKLAGRKAAGQTDGNKKVDENKDADKKLDMNFLHRHNYNVSEVMGTLLKHRYEFSRLERLKRAYTDAFAVDFPSIDTLVDEKMFALVCARNLLVHKAGKADQKFVNNARGIPMFASLSVGDELFLDGKLVAELIDATIRSGIALVRAVDDWLGAH